MRGRGKDDLRLGGGGGGTQMVLCTSMAVVFPQSQTLLVLVRYDVNILTDNISTVSPAVIWISNISPELVVATAG